MRFPFIFLHLLFVQSGTATVNLSSRASKYGHFENPDSSGIAKDYTQNAYWIIGETQRVRWVTTLDEYTVALWQERPGTNYAAAPGPDIYRKQKTDSELGGFDWVVQTYNFDINDSPIFYFWIVSPDLEQFDWPSSHYFNISKVVASSRSTSISTSTSTSSSSSPPSNLTPTPTQTPSSTAPAPTPPAPTIASNPPKSNNSLALGVGLGLGIPFVLLLGILAGMKLVKSRQSNSALPAPEAQSIGPYTEVTASEPPPNYGWIYKNTAPEWALPVELMGNTSPLELHGRSQELK
ncbi:hypothetical protein GQ43DRAFT_468026 [Delitschia confertaspora ATCC 74209]|uniref:Mid2 domain-containing protein n=1 Tax=Delitschia confertaspora ATCC 74209 TaxID=1513339 RepID=A0A9P4MTP5_9PLEO|nr:hypothetical protein GQ43DRAFT_468026 [Delitschia confertaspora ATCC 74209]